LTSSADAVLEFSFSGDCWLEVRDGDGQLIYADLRRAGDRLALDGNPPFQVLAGNAAAVALSFRGEPVPVRTRPGRETARFTVGEP
jgi:cytoskeleton protein RodZ